MKSTLALLAAALSVATASSLFHKPAFLQQSNNYYNATEVMSEFKFMSKMIYATYNGFARGLYREQSREVISSQCLGDWVSQNLTYLDKVWNQIYDFKLLDIPYEDAMEAAKDMVNLIYRNRDACDVDHIVNDLTEFCPEDSCLEDIDVVANIKANLLVLIAKVEPVLDFLFSPNYEFDDTTDEDVLKMADTMGDAYGSLISYILGFDKRYLNHKLRTIA